MTGRRSFILFDACQTSRWAKRLLRPPILRPLVDAEALTGRYEACGEARESLVKPRKFERAFAGLLDLSDCWRGLSRFQRDHRDVRALAASVDRLPGLKTALDTMHAARWGELA